MIVIGFTGTRHGMTKLQMAAFLATIRDLQPSEFHHGDCIGADDEAALSVAYLDVGQMAPITIVCHPPLDESHRAFNKHAFRTLPPKTHFARNRDIVDAADMLIACPCDMTPQPRGGTWYTVGYARKKGKRVVIIWPDGTVG